MDRRLHRDRGLLASLDLRVTLLLRADAIKRDEPDLILDIEVVYMTLMENQLKEGGLGVYVDGLEFASLEAASLVAVKGQVAQLFELYFVEGDLLRLGGRCVGVKGEQFYFLADFGLVREELKLL